MRYLLLIVAAIAALLMVLNRRGVRMPAALSALTAWKVGEKTSIDAVSYDSVHDPRAAGPVRAQHMFPYEGTPFEIPESG